MPPSSRYPAWLRPRDAPLGLFSITLAILCFFIGTSSAISTAFSAKRAVSGEGDRSGNWTSLTCSDPAVQDALWMGCAQRWSELDADDAWKDVIRVWTQLDEGKTTFSSSVMKTLHASNDTDCGILTPKGGCDQTQTCGYFEGIGDDGGSGPAAYLIYNSFTIINEMYYVLFDAIQSAVIDDINLSLAYMESTFALAPLKPDDEWLPILLNLLHLGVTAIAAAFFGGFFRALPGLVALGDTGADTAKDITSALLEFGTAIVSDTIDGGSKKQWTPRPQTNFGATVGQVLSAWSAVVENQLYALFNGSEASVKLLGSMMANGKLLECNGTSSSDFVPSDSQLESFISKVFHGLSIPAIWNASGTHAFVVDSGYPCGTINPLTEYMTEDTQEATYSCHNGSLYYLVHPDGDWHGCVDGACKSSHFTAPPGLDALSSGSWGNITLSDLIAGSVNTYVANGNANGRPTVNLQSQQTLQDLVNQDITTPGYITLPVCSPQVAWASWANPKSSAPGYPCNPLQT